MFYTLKNSLAGFALIAGLNIVVFPVFAGADGDGLPTAAENCTGFYINSNDTGTCDNQTACNAQGTCIVDTDFDNDGLSDFIERNYSNNSGPYLNGGDTGTNPLVADTDSDGLNDNIEKCSGVFVDFNDTGTCPTRTSCNNLAACFNASNGQDYDNDTFLDGADNCPLIAGAQTDTDGDGRGDVCDADDDNDGVLDTAPDSCQAGDTGWTSTPATDHDGDGCRDAGTEDADDDNDGVLDTAPDSCPTGDTGWTSNSTTDNDGDGCRDTTEDTDDDNDSIADSADNCQLIPNADQANNGGNPALGDACDPDMDGDGLLNTADACPLDSRLAGTINGYDENCSQICWRPHIGVPGNNNPPAIDGDVASDVGWSGAHRVTFGNGTDLPHVTFQGLKDKTSDFFYLSFEVKNDSNGLTNDDMVIMTFRPNINLSATSFEQNNHADDLRFIITPGNDAVVISKYTTDWTNISSPTGFQFAKSAPDSNSWNIEIKLPVSTAAGGTSWPTFGNDFKFFFDVIRNDGSTSTEFVWPDHNHRVNGDILNYPYFASEWGVGTKDPTKQCNGVFLTATDFGTNNVPANSINLNSANTFFANVKNLTFQNSAFQPADDVRVRFRIADWGIAVGDETSSSWREIPASPPTSGCTSTDRNPSCEKDIPAATTAASPGMATFNLDWTVDPADKAKYDPALGGYKHQCILLEINSLSGANIVTKSARRNMNFAETASIFERKAKISSAGLGKPLTGDKHKIILRDTRDIFKPFKAGSNKSYLKDHPDADEETLVTKTRWLVHGYKETGMFVKYRGSSFPITEPVASFGYVITHSGEAVNQWNYDIKGDGVSKEKDTGGDYYTVLVPGDGASEIITRVESIEPDNASLLELIKNNPWLIFIILLILYLLWRAIRKNSTT